MPCLVPTQHCRRAPVQYEGACEGELPGTIDNDRMRPDFSFIDDAATSFCESILTC
jgi:hypothetical protein